jgi:hypothetical protein
MVAQDKQPKTLSPTASQYYTFVAIRGMLPILLERDQLDDKRQVNSAVVRQGLADLKKLRTMADGGIRPLIDVWSRFIEAWTAVQSGSGSKRTLETQRQALLDEMVRLRADQELMQKMLKEGI